METEPPNDDTCSRGECLNGIEANLTIHERAGEWNFPLRESLRGRHPLLAIFLARFVSCILSSNQDHETTRSPMCIAILDRTFP
jgi:hypothetical protein